jgi:hypothetical protein
VILVAGEALYDLVLQGTDDRVQADPGMHPATGPLSHRNRSDKDNSRT